MCACRHVADVAAKRPQSINPVPMLCQQAPATELLAMPCFEPVSEIEFVWLFIGEPVGPVWDCCAGDAAEFRRAVSFAVLSDGQLVYLHLLSIYIYILNTHY